MNHPGNEEDRLNDLWREDEMYIEDNGFTGRVMDRLPPPRRTSRWRTPILLASALLACLVGLVLLPGGEYITQALYEVVAYRPAQSPLPLIPMALVLLLVGGGVAAAVHE